MEQEQGCARADFERDAAVIATGSRPYRPPDVDFTHPRIFDSDTILDLAAHAAIDHDLRRRRGRLRIRLDVSQPRREGEPGQHARASCWSFSTTRSSTPWPTTCASAACCIRHNEEYERVEGRDDGVVLHLKSGKKLKTDVLLWANGRTGNSDGLGLEALGITPDRRGQIAVNETIRRRVPHIYAVGDVIGFPSLASAAYDQGRFAAAHLLHGTRDQLVGHSDRHLHQARDQLDRQTERELTDADVPYEVGHALFKSLARAQITGQTVGMLKLLFHRETLEILGIHCFGDQARRRSSTSARRSCRSPAPQHAAATSSTRRSTIRRWPKPTAWRR